ncbi:MAG: hypothetical protein K2W96_23410 [Gemmataceae bacterium]|nr:hypothetical protein [Gemmataceae bacterium]
MSGLLASIFTDLNLPNPATWLYFSGLLSVALFFKFGRLVSLRNLDLLALFLFGPGLLLLAESHARHRQAHDAALFLFGGGFLLPADGGRDALGYGCLLLACLYFLARSLLDLGLVRRPALSSNMELPGLAWLAGALFVSLAFVTLSHPARPAYEGPAPSALNIPGLVDRALPEVSLRVVERVLSLLCHLSVAVGLAMVGWRVFENAQAGMSAATLYLLLPYVFLLAPESPSGAGRWDHSWPMALFVWSVFCYRTPLLAGAFLGLSMGTAWYMVVTLPAWLSFYGQRGAVRFLAGFVTAGAVAVGLLGFLWWLNGELPEALRSGWMTFDWQPWRKPPERSVGFWQSVPGWVAAYRLPVFFAAASVPVLSLFWPRPKDLAHVLALSSASLISIQFWHADRGGVYVLWFLPLLLLMVFRPNLSERRAPELPPDGWPVRLARWALGVAKWTIRLALPADRPGPRPTPQPPAGKGAPPPSV